MPRDPRPITDRLSRQVALDMSDDDSTDRITPPHQLRALRRHRGDITLDERLDAIEDSLEDIRDKLGNGSSTFASISLRLKMIELIVYTGCGVTLLAVLGALIYLVVKGGSAGHP
jgi:hypothetical protein